MADIDRRFLDLMIHGLEEITGIIVAERLYTQSGVTTLHVFRSQVAGRFRMGRAGVECSRRNGVWPRPLRGNPAPEEVRENG